MGDSLLDITQDLQTSLAKLEHETSLERELTNERDLAWTTYQILLQKETEIQTGSPTNTEVSLAGEAIPPENPISRGTVLKTVVGGAMGIFLGIILVLATTWWKYYRENSTE